MKEIVSKAIEIARGEEGTLEHGRPNHGKQVDEYQKRTGYPHGGVPWCACFVYWCIDEAANGQKAVNPFLRSGSCDLISAWAKKHEILMTDPEPGDVFLYYSSPNDASHTGFVTAVSGTVFATMEGNTNINGSREGIGVFKRERQDGPKYRYVRWANLASAASAAKDEPTWALHLNDAKIGEVIVRAGVAWAPVEVWGKCLGLSVDWEQDDQHLVLGKHEFPGEIDVINDMGYAPLRKLAAFSGLIVTPDAARNKVTVSKPGA